MRSYRLATTLAAPLLPLLLYLRRLQGKEDPLRLPERFGRATKPRPKGTLLWLHAASVGEANSILVLIKKLRGKYPHIHLLLTTGTVTSAALMRSRLPKEVIHQYVPIDTRKAVRRFLRHWKPDLAFWVESEFWPNLVLETNEAEAFMGIINGRMSELSFAGWQKRASIIRPMLASFNIAFAQTEEDGKRLETLGAKDVFCVGNLKYDAALLPCNENELVDLKDAIGDRPVWLAASTHPGEEALIEQTHHILAAAHPGLLTIIVPRHPNRGAEIAEALRKKLTVALRSQKHPVTSATNIYVADTLGELGLFYRLCDIVFTGGSLVRHGGQNPLEPARLSCAILTGPHTHNFAEIYRDMEQSGVVLRVTSAENLAAQAGILLNTPETRDRLQAGVRQWMEGKDGAADRLLDALDPVLAAPGGDTP